MNGELEALEENLFSAARGERATPAVRARVLASAVAASRKQSHASVASIVGPLALAAGVGGLVWFGVSETGPASIDRERLSPVSTETKRATNDAKSTVEPSPRPSPSATSTLRRPSAPHPAASLSEEIELLEQARSALADGSSGRALELLHRYDVTLRGTRLRAEATMLRIEALSAAGRANEAAGLARAFVRENPGSPLADRARSFATGANDHHTEEDPGRKKP